MIKIFKDYFFKKRLKMISELGNNVFIDNSTLLSNPTNIYIENNVHIQYNCSLFADGDKIIIKEGTILAHNVQIFTRNHLYDAPDLKYIPYDERYSSKKVVIGKYVWLGANVIILPGVMIGDGAVIGAGAVISKDIPECAVVVGNPGKIVKYRNKERFEYLLSHDCGYIKNCKIY